MRNEEGRKGGREEGRKEEGRKKKERRKENEERRRTGARRNKKGRRKGRSSLLGVRCGQVERRVRWPPVPAGESGLGLRPGPCPVHRAIVRLWVRALCASQTTLRLPSLPIHPSLLFFGPPRHSTPPLSSSSSASSLILAHPFLPVSHSHSHSHTHILLLFLHNGKGNRKDGPGRDPRRQQETLLGRLLSLALPLALQHPLHLACPQQARPQSTGSTM